MSDIEIFVIGVFTFIMLAGGLAFTIYEVPRLHNQGDKKN